MILAELPSGDWTLAGSIMTFAIPVGLFVIVATALYFLYTRPHVVPGHRDLVPAGRHAAGAAPAAAAPSAAAPPPAAPPSPEAQPPGDGTLGTGRHEAPGGTEGTE
jgi:hypothetical protein